MPLWEIVSPRGRVFSPFGRVFSPFGRAFSPLKNGFGINIYIYICISEDTLVCPKRSFLCKTYLLGKRQKLSTLWRGRYMSSLFHLFDAFIHPHYIHVLFSRPSTCILPHLRSMYSRSYLPRQSLTTGQIRMLACQRLLSRFSLDLCSHGFGRCAYI